MSASRIYLSDRCNSARNAVLVVEGKDDADIARAARAIAQTLDMRITSGVVHEIAPEGR